jgi:hypothetical protein
MLLLALADGGVGSIGFMDCAVEGDAAPPPPHAASRNKETTTPQIRPIALGDLITDPIEPP